jgi:hypothetical protein
MFFILNTNMDNLATFNCIGLEMKFFGCTFIICYFVMLGFVLKSNSELPNWGI